MSLVRKFATVASGTLMSRALGFAREMFMANALGTGPVADAFNAAFQFPNTFRRLFAEGAFNTAFVPLFAKEIEANGMAGAPIEGKSASAIATFTSTEIAAKYIGVRVSSRAK